MSQGYEINDLAKEESWRMFRIMGELIGGFDRLSGVEPAVTIYGSARTRPEDPLYATTEEIARRLGKLGFSIITGGGPGVMEAANKGALAAGATSVGLNIDLPEEQTVNQYTTLSIEFNHFFVRKVMLAKYATAFIIIPGGLGTLDEVTEILCLIQTHKMRPFPVILFDSAYWAGLLNWMRQHMLAKGYIEDEDLRLLVVCDSIDEVVEAVREWYGRQKLVDRRALHPNGQRVEVQSRATKRNASPEGNKEGPK